MAIIHKRLLLAALPFVSPVSSFVSPRQFLLSTAIASSSSYSTAIMAEVKVGDTLPDVAMKELVTGADGPVEVKLTDLIKGKKVAIFGVPGA
eukprot:scaffold3314_cov162-Amphora_coffeaeformis.AAC.5